MYSISISNKKIRTCMTLFIDKRMKCMLRNFWLSLPAENCHTRFHYICSKLLHTHTHKMRKQNVSHVHAFHLKYALRNFHISNMFCQRTLRAQLLKISNYDARTAVNNKIIIRAKCGWICARVFEINQFCLIFTHWNFFVIVFRSCFHFVHLTFGVRSKYI